jgi:hypothetical protein
MDNWVPPSHYSSAPVILADQSVTRPAPNPDSMANFNAPYEPPPFSAGLWVYLTQGIPDNELGDLQMMPMNKSKSKSSLRWDNPANEGDRSNNDNNNNNDGNNHNNNNNNNNNCHSNGRSRERYRGLHSHGSHGHSRGEPQDQLVGTSRGRHINKVDIAAASEGSNIVLQASTADTNKHYDKQILENHAATNGMEEYVPIDHDFW